MKCDKHPDMDAEHVCSVCGSGICEECDFVFRNKHYCMYCRENAVENANIDIDVEKKSLQSKIDMYFVSMLVLSFIVFILGLIIIFLLYLNSVNKGDLSYINGNYNAIGQLLMFILPMIALIFIFAYFRNDVKKKKELLKYEV